MATKKARAQVSRAQERWLRSLLFGTEAAEHVHLLPGAQRAIQRKFLDIVATEVRRFFPVLFATWEPSDAELLAHLHDLGKEGDAITIIAAISERLGRAFANDPARGGLRDLLAIEGAIAQLRLRRGKRVCRVRLETDLVRDYPSTLGRRLRRAALVASIRKARGDIVMTWRPAAAATRRRRRGVS
jgi:hypothetical protein